MKVLIWQEHNPQVGGGAESWVKDTAAAMRRRGWEVAWLHSPQIRRAVAEFRPDAVLIGTIHNFIGIDHAAALLDGGIPAVWYLHDYWPFCGPRMLMKDHNQSDRNCEAGEGKCQNSCGGAHPVPEIVAQFPQATNCETAASIMRRHGLKVEHVVEPGIDTDAFYPEPTERDAPQIVAASAAWNAPWKGMHLLQRAIQGTPLIGRIVTGLPRDRVAAELRRASIFAFPSVYQETWGLALTEAMASGCACVAFDVAGARAQIQGHGQPVGFLVQPHDVEALREGLLYLLDHPADREMIGERARAHVAEHHSLDALGERWERTLAEVMACAV